MIRFKSFLIKNKMNKFETNYITMKHNYTINKILIPLDLSETSLLALEYAALVCEKFKADVHLLHVHSSTSFDVLPNFSTNILDEEEVKRNISDELGNYGERLKNDFGINYTVEIRGGSIAKEIGLAANEVNADLIVMGSHGVNGFQEFFMGSNAFRVVTSAKVPVLTVKDGVTPKDLPKIVMPIDSSSHTRDKVAETTTIAKAFGAEVHILTLITEEHEDEKAKFNLKVKQIEEHFDNDGVNYIKEIRHGDDIAEMTLQYSKEVDARLVVIMTEQEARTVLFMGPYAQRIVNHSMIPVLSVTPIEVIDCFGQDDLGGSYTSPFS